MKNVVHKIYHLTFPCGKDYVGSTSTSFNMRYGNYRNDAKTSKSPILVISTQYRFKEVNMVEIDRIECPMHDSKIKMLEEKWKLKLNPTLNVQKAYRSPEEDKKAKRLYNHTNKKYIKEYIKEYSKTPKGRLNSGVADAKMNIKQYTKQNRPDMVKKWEGILEERIQNRLAHQSK
jgi:hypothetical protein